MKITSSPQNGVNIQMIQDEEGSVDKLPGDSVEDVPLFDTMEVSLESLDTNGSLGKPSQPETSLRSLWSKRHSFVPRLSTSEGQEADERLLSHAIGRSPTSSSRPRFLTLHRRERRRPPTRALTKGGAVLDDLYNGPTQCVLKGAAQWEFNAFVLDSVSGGRPVTVLCVFLLHQYNLLTQFALDAVTVWKCFSLIEEGYHSSNPYHNAIHAADVTQAMHCYLRETAIDQYLTPFEKLGAIIASVCHDLDHPGVNQPFLIATDNHLAALYDNASVLENHHWRCAMGCLWESGFLDTWPQRQVDELQEIMRSLILATDITRQGEFLSRFEKYQETNTLDMRVAECRHFSLQIALKCADICNPCRTWETSRQWSQKICDEFYRQGDYERQLQLPVTPMCDRFTKSIASIQTGFIKFVVAPLFESWHRWLETDLSSFMLTNLRQNLERWESILKDELGDNRPLQESESNLMEVKEGSLQPPIPASVVDHASMGSTAECYVVGRRHSLPPMPSLLPRTIIRRESLPNEEGGPPLVFETLHMGSSTADSRTTAANQPLSMGESAKPRRFLSHSRPQRRKSLPPLWDNASLLSRPLLQAMPPTPLQEEQQQPSDVEKEDESKPLLATGSGTPWSGRGSRKNGGESSVSHKPLQLESRHSVGLGTCMDALESDKENVAPAIDRTERPTPNGIMKTRFWRSLNQEDENVPNSTGIGPKFLFKHLPPDDLMRRRGSAPLLKLEEIRSSFKVGLERSQMDLLRRRGSAPTNPLGSHFGSDTVRLLPADRGTHCQPNPFSKENAVSSDRNPLIPLSLRMGTNRLAQRRGSAPWESSNSADHQVFLPNPRFKEKRRVVLDEGEGLPISSLPLDSQIGLDTDGGGFLTPHLDTRRGSTGFELLSGLWRLRLEQTGASLCSDESVGVSSSGGATPGTPGVPLGLTSNLFQGPLVMPGPILRRGSLPTDVFIGGENFRCNDSS